MLNKKKVTAQFQIALTVASLVAIISHFIFKNDFLLLVVSTVGALPLLVQIALKLFKKEFGADLLAAIALMLAIYLAQYLAATLLIIMLAGGQILENYATRKASSVLRHLADRMPAIAHLRNDGVITEINCAEIKVGDEIVIYPHELCPVDGDVIEGHGVMDESYLTGEPYKISKAPGARVLSGAINGNDVLVIRADKLAQDSRYAKIMTVMEEAQQRKPQLMRMADQLGAIFTPLALLFACGAWYFSGDIMRFLAVLVVATPCPLLIAIPITIISAISMSAKRGIVIKDPTVLERLPTCRIAIFDKTGTLTYGQPELTNIFVSQNFSREEILQKTASLEKYSRHPLAYAILKAAQKENLQLLEAENVSEKPGEGLSGQVAGQKILVTSRTKLKNNSEILALLPPLSSGLECVILIDGNYAATLRLHDTPRLEGLSFIKHLGPQHNFSRVILLSGDRESEVKYLAETVGIKETYASQSPEQKLQFVKNETKKAATLFMGDGINDAPALMAATVGLAFGQNNNVTSEAAGAVIMDSTLIKVDELFHISLKMRQIAIQSAVGGMVLSVCGMVLAAYGMLSPAAGAFFQEIIDIVAILNALRMTWESKIGSDIKN